MQTCIWLSLCHCYSLSLASVKSRLVLPFWYRLTRVVPEKGPLNGCVCVTPPPMVLCLPVCLLMCCLFVCPQASLRNYMSSLHQVFCMLPMAETLSSFGGVAIYYVIPVLWMALCLHIMARNSRHQYTHPFNGPFYGTTQVSQYQTGKTSLVFLLKQVTVSGSGISWAVCKSAPRCRQITTPAPHRSVFTGRMPFLPPNQQRQTTGGHQYSRRILKATQEGGSTDWGRSLTSVIAQF